MIPYEELVAALSRWRAAQGLPTGPADYLGEPAPVSYDYVSTAAPEHGAYGGHGGALAHDDVVDLSDDMLDGVVEESQVDAYPQEAPAGGYGEQAYGEQAYGEQAYGEASDPYGEQTGYEVQAEEAMELEAEAAPADADVDAEPYHAESYTAEAYGADAEQTYAGEMPGAGELEAGEEIAAETADEEIEALIEDALPVEAAAPDDAPDAIDEASGSAGAADEPPADDGAPARGRRKRKR